MFLKSRPNNYNEILSGNTPNCMEASRYACNIYISIYIYINMCVEKLFEILIPK